jgi:hypothetical protein
MVSGGYSGVAGSSTKQWVVDSYPVAANQWKVTLSEADSDSSWTIYAVCAK